MIEITPFLNPSTSEPLYMQLYSYIKKEIQHGKIEPGMKLPSKRKLSIHLRISQHTVETAYQQLIAEGYVESKPRKGLYVNSIHEDIFPNNTPLPKVVKRESLVQNNHYKIDFSHGKVALENFPYSVWRKLTVQGLHDDQLFFNGDRQGELTLRGEIAKYLYQSRGVRCSAEQIVIGAGTQYLIGLLTMVIGRDSIYSMEDPGFHRTRVAFKDQGVTLKAIPLDEEGINLEQLKNSKANVTYVTPSHQFPNGIVMPIARRLDLLKWAAESNGFIIEDDYDGEFRYKGKPIPSLQGLDPNGRVIYLGTFSKSLIPSLRISFMVLPKEILASYQSHFTIYKQTVSRLHQYTLYEFMKNGHWDRHLNKMRTTYRKKQKTLIQLIDEYFGNNVIMIGDDSGLHILLNVRNEMSEQELINAAAEKEVKIYPTSIYYENYIHDLAPKVLLGFAGLMDNEIKQGIQLLKEAWF
ncbi:PLP-dependent aminotransferase family protein [Halalkalibacter flavus]|uniref:MocR-like pyridoxine biosynthesis transcription factor PdxR n=1 Tax=Halalkalibacter flavus TaxID=3090668 RepID=UPI002FC9156B